MFIKIIPSLAKVLLAIVIPPVGYQVKLISVFKV